jgi:hypothetical protein
VSDSSHENDKMDTENEKIENEDTVGTEVVLEKFQVYVATVIPQTLGIVVDNVEVMLDEIFHDMMLRMRAYIWGEPPKVWRVKAPADWWQHFKERWFPEWALKRWPMVYRIDTVKMQVLYDRMKISMPDEHYIIHTKIDTQELSAKDLEERELDGFVGDDLV